MRIVWVVICSLTLSFGAAVGVNLQKLSMTREDEMNQQQSRDDDDDDDDNREDDEHVTNNNVGDHHNNTNEDQKDEEIIGDGPSSSQSKTRFKSSMSNQEKKKTEGGRPPYLQPLWCVGLGMIVLDAIGDFIFIGLAPQSLLAPLGSFSLGWNMILAPWFHTNEVVTCSILGATAIIYVGTILTILFAADSSPTYNLETLKSFLRTPQFIIYEIACAFILLFLVMYKSKYWYPMMESFHFCCCGIRQSHRNNPSLNQYQRQNAQERRDISESNSSISSSNDNNNNMNGRNVMLSSRPRYVTSNNDVDEAGPDSAVFINDVPFPEEDVFSGHHHRNSTFGVVHYCGIAGCLGGQCIMFAKSASELIKNAILTNDFSDWTTSALPYMFLLIMIITVLTQIHYLNQGLKKFDALIVVPVYQSIWNIFGISGGLIFFQEYSDMTSKDAALYTLGILITLVGVTILVHQRQRYVSVSIVAEAEADNSHPNATRSGGDADAILAVPTSTRTRKRSSTSDEHMKQTRLEEELSLPVIHNEHTTLVAHPTTPVHSFHGDDDDIRVSNNGGGGGGSAAAASTSLTKMEKIC